MRSTLTIYVLLGIVMIIIVSPCLSAETKTPGEESSKYLDAVREFANNVLKYGRDTYGPKHTPLFVDGLNIHTHEPVKWISPKGDLSETTETKEWVLSNFASQQTLLRTLYGLTAITGDRQYRDAAIQATKYALENLMGPKGLLYWGEGTAYDALGDTVCGGEMIESIKLHYPYYELMWKVDPEVTEKLIGTIWSAHVVDWSNLEIDRIGSRREDFEKPWDHEYKRGPTIFESKRSWGISNVVTASSLIQAGATLNRLSGDQQPLIWSKRLAKRFVDTRYPNTGISSLTYGGKRWQDRFVEDIQGNSRDPNAAVFPWDLFQAPPRSHYYPENAQAQPWIALFLVGELLGENGKELTQWAIEELNAWGKASYRKQNNCFVPMLTDGTSLEGYVWKNGPGQSTGYNKVRPYPADMSFFWAYSIAYGRTGDEFMWEMVRSIALGNELGDIGQTPMSDAARQISTNCSHRYGIFGFLELYRKTNQRVYLEVARRIADNIVEDRFYKGFFVPSKKHFYMRVGCFEPLALLRLEAVMGSKSDAVPQPWPCLPLFVYGYRHKIQGVDRHVIYGLTESSESPISIEEAAAIGDIDRIKELIGSGVRVGAFDSLSYMTPLHRAAMEGQKSAVELLLAEDAPINERDIPLNTPLTYAVINNHKDIAELLIDNGANVNAKNNDGQTPLEIAQRRNLREIVELLAKVPDIPSIHVAAQLGDMDKVKALLEEGADVNAKDENGMTPLLLAISNKQVDLAKFLIEKGADINLADRQGVVPLFRALWNKDLDMLELLLKKGADVNTKHAKSGFTALHWAAMMDSKDSVELILDAGADVNAKSNTGETSLDVAAIWGVSPAMAELLVTKGAEVLSLHAAAHLGDLPKVRAFISEGVEVNRKSGLIEGTALHSAAAAGHKEMVKFLINKGSDVNAQNGPGRTPLHMAAQKGHWDVVQLLLKNGADVNVKDRRERGRTPLELARENGHTQIVEILTKKSSSPQGLVKEPQKIEQSEVAGEATQLLFSAVKTSDIEQVKEQLASGADVDAKDATGRMPVHYAAANGRKEIVELLTTAAVRPGSFEDRELTKVKSLLSKGLNVNAQAAASKTTLLHYAAQTGYVYVAAYLIVHDANVDAENQSGHTPLDIALQWKEPTIALLLLDTRATATKRDRSTILLKAAGQIGPYGEKRAGYENYNQMVKSSGGSGSKHDIAISKTSAVKTCIQGDIVPVTVTLDNRGQQEESASVTLCDGNTVVAVRQIKLGVSAQNGPEHTPDIVFDPENITWNVFGQRVCIGGDVNGDGFGDLLIGAWRWQNSRGRAYLYFGGSQMDNVADVIFTGTNEGDAFANQSGVFGDVNNDGYYDVIIGAGGNVHGDIHDGYVHVYLGGPHMDNVADIVLNPAEAGRRGGFSFVASGDVDNDGYCDILVGEPWSRRVSLFWGGDPMSTSTNVVFEGTENAFPFSHRMSIGGDVNGDGYNDIIIGSRESGVSKRPDNENKQGRAYLYLGNTKEQMDTDCDWLFVDKTPGSSFGSAVDIFDIDNDGYDDVIIAARYASSLRGRVYVYWGSESFDGSEPGVIFEPKEVSGAGEYLQVGHINSDLFGDILVGGWIYPGQPYRHGRAYVFYGNSKDAIDTDCDYIFEGEGRTEDWFGAQLGIGDVNNDGYTDAIFGAWGANHWAGRAYLFYGPFSSTTNITFKWDTTNASIGKHTHKVKIAPVPGEENTEDNVKTVTIEVKEPRK